MKSTTIAFFATLAALSTLAAPIQESSIAVRDVDTRGVESTVKARDLADDIAADEARVHASQLIVDQDKLTADKKLLAKQKAQKAAAAAKERARKKNNTNSRNRQGTVNQNSRNRNTGINKVPMKSAASGNIVPGATRTARTGNRKAGIRRELDELEHIVARDALEDQIAADEAKLHASQLLVDQDQLNSDKKTLAKVKAKKAAWKRLAEKTRDKSKGKNDKSLSAQQKKYRNRTGFRGGYEQRLSDKITADESKVHSSQLQVDKDTLASRRAQLAASKKKATTPTTTTTGAKTKREAFDLELENLD